MFKWDVIDFPKWLLILELLSTYFRVFFSADFSSKHCEVRYMIIANFYKAFTLNRHCHKGYAQGYEVDTVV